jgi:redox-sensitive bicupin YhaK (pirin superfamily)
MAKSIKVMMGKHGAHWVGNGFHVVPVFGEQAFNKALSPFLMFDYGAPKEFSKTREKRGIGMHPHRGFETITVAYQGEVEHKDSKGHTGIISPGDVQWMTAGSGIFHEEFHSTAFAQSGGVMEMVQLWVNLPASLKMTTPKYQAIEAKTIPEVALPANAGTVKVIAGEFEGVKGAAATQAFDQPRGMVQLWDISLTGTQPVELKIPANQTTILFARKGTVNVGDRTLPEHRAALLTEEGSVVPLSCSEPCSLLIMGGDPIRDQNGNVEPIAAYGPMVMNTDQEIREAMAWARQEQAQYRG